MRLATYLPLTLLAALLVLVALPAAGAQPGSGGSEDGPADPTTIDFYGHVFGHGGDTPMPANVEYPVGESNYGLGTFHWCTGAFSYTLGSPTETLNTDRDCENSYVNSLILYSTAGFVDVSSRDEFVNGGAYSQLHNERGQQKPLLIDTSKEVTAKIQMTLDAHAWLVANAQTDCAHPHPQGTPCAYPYWGWDVMAQPDYQVKATLYHAQLGEYKGAAARQPPIMESLRNGEAEVIAQGATEPQLVANGLPNTPKVLEFNINLGQPNVTQIPKTHDFFLVYKFYSNSDGEKASAHTWRIWSGEFFPPKFTLPVRNPFAVESVIPQFVHDKLVILGVMSSPWGSYDINPDATTLTVRDKETGDTVSPESIEAFNDYSVAHGGHFAPANVTYVWDYKRDNLEPGTYEITVSGENFQGNAQASCTANVTIQQGGSPGPVDVGLCGFQSLSEEKREELREEAGESAGDGERLSHPDPLPETAGATLFGILGLAALPGRWRP